MGRTYVAACTIAGVAALATAPYASGGPIAGIGFGAAFQGAVRSVVPLAAPQERAGVLAVLYVIAYLAMGLPAVLAGIGVVYGGGMVATANEYGAAVMALAVLAYFGTVFAPTVSEIGDSAEPVPSRP